MTFVAPLLPVITMLSVPGNRTTLKKNLLKVQFQGDPLVHYDLKVMRTHTTF